ncbi:uncharacterized protein [Palaemon carinicauda]|uniref:uncharacterized protein n=1 Tax=Palaemon carinicauda TaxID=392227 RepID=UPI0035B60B5C
MKDLGELKSFLGIQFKTKDDCIVISQKQYFEKVLEKFDMKDYKPRVSPCEVGLDKDEDVSPIFNDPRCYREIVGSLIYAMVATRPDLSYIVIKQSQKMSKPTVRDLNVAKGVLRNLKETLDYALELRKSNGPVNL